MSSLSRLIVVSNQDPRIKYEGEWSLSDSSSFQNLGSFGPPLEDSLHMTTSESSFAFSFNGGYIGVLGLVNSSSSKFECLIDGIEITLGDIITGENNVHLCTSTFHDGHHTLLVNISTQSSPFVLDNLQYAPSANVPLDNATIIIPNIDPSITFSPEWTQLGEFAQNMTEATNAFANVSFVGNRLGWFGTIPGSEPHAPSSAEYSIDDGPFISFTLSGLPSGASNSNDIFNVPFFTTEILEQGSHALFVRYLGNGSTTPLTLNNLLVINASTSTTITSSSPSSSTSSSSSSISPDTSPNAQSGRRQGKSTGAIVGGVLGGVVGFGLMIALLFMYRKRSRSRELVANPDAIMPFLIDAPSSPHAPMTRESRLPNSTTTSQRTKSDPTMQMVHTQALDSSSQQGPSTSITPSVVGPAQSLDRIPSLPMNPQNPTPAEEEPLVRIQHEDSGLRIINSGLNNVIELPPNYTLT